MLRAQSARVETEYRVRMLRIRDKELDFFTRNSQNLGQLSALIAGFAYTGLIYTKYIDSNLCSPEEFLCAEITYPICVTITMCLALFSLWGCMLVTLLAPGLALRGPSGSMNRCVDMMGQEYQYMLFVFACSVVMMVFCAIFWSWTARYLPATVSLTLVSTFFLYLLYLTSLRTIVRFDVPRSQLVTGRFGTGEPPPAAGRPGGRGRGAPQPQRHSPTQPQRARAAGSAGPGDGAATLDQVLAAARGGGARTALRDLL